MEQEKRVLDVPAIILCILGIAVLILVISFVYFSIYSKDYTGDYREESGEIKNETEFEIIDNADLSSSQEEMVKYIAIVLKLYNLHEIPYTEITPKIQFSIDENNYFVEIKKGDIIINKGEAVKGDIRIKTTSEEIIKIQENEDYAKESISAGKTTIEKIAHDFTLFSKGYLDLYNEISL